MIGSNISFNTGLFLLQGQSAADPALKAIMYGGTFNPSRQWENANLCSKRSDCSILMGLQQLLGFPTHFYMT
jgi:hypothetical protein